MVAFQAGVENVVVRVAVTDGNAKVAVVGAVAVFGEAVGDPPAEEDALTVAARRTTPEYGPL